MQKKKTVFPKTKAKKAKKPVKYFRSLFSVFFYPATKPPPLSPFSFTPLLQDNQYARARSLISKHFPEPEIKE